MPIQAFDGIRVLSIGPAISALEILADHRTTVTVEGGHVEIVQSGETLSVSQGSGVAARSAPSRAGSAFANATVTTSGPRGAASATVRSETARAASDSNSTVVGDSQDAPVPDKITINVPEGTAIEGLSQDNDVRMAHLDPARQGGHALYCACHGGVARWRRELPLRS